MEAAQCIIRMPSWILCRMAGSQGKLADQAWSHNWWHLYGVSDTRSVAHPSCWKTFTLRTCGMLLHFAVMRQMSVPATLLGILMETSLSCLLHRSFLSTIVLYDSIFPSTEFCSLDNTFPTGNWHVDTNLFTAQRIQKKDALHECLKLQGSLSQNAHKALWKVLTPSDSAFDD